MLSSLEASSAVTQGLGLAAKAGTGAARTMKISQRKRRKGMGTLSGEWENVIGGEGWEEN